MSFRRELGTFDATMVVVGGIIGAGIFINPYIVAQRLDSGWLVMAAWIAGGGIAIAGRSRSPSSVRSFPPPVAITPRVQDGGGPWGGLAGGHARFGRPCW